MRELVQIKISTYNPKCQKEIEKKKPTNPSASST